MGRTGGTRFKTVSEVDWDLVTNFWKESSECHRENPQGGTAVKGCPTQEETTLGPWLQAVCFAPVSFPSTIFKPWSSLQITKSYTTV